MVGFLKISYGCMFSGKTTHLVENILNYINLNELKNKKVKILIINSKKDIRKNLKQISNLSTHDKLKNYNFPEYLEFVKVNKLNDIEKKFLEGFDYVAIDECQFFDDLKENVNYLLKNDKYVHCAGLMSDSDKNLFGQLYLLIPLADKVNQLKAHCLECDSVYKTGIFTKFIGKDKLGIIHIGDKDYTAVCRKHY